MLTKAEFRARSLDQWLFSTGAGVALIGGALLGLLVGTVIVAQTLYSSTKDHLHEFATLRALGSSASYIHRVILTQAGVSAVLGYLLGMAIALVITALQRTDRIADRDDTGARGRSVRDHGRDVRDLGGVGDHEGHQDRSSHGVQPMNGDVVLEAKNIIKELGQGAGMVRALKGVSLTLRAGELTLLMGPSGSGKTTLLSILGCILAPTTGTVEIAGERIEGLGPEALAGIRRRHVGFIFQSYNLFPTLTALENVRLALNVKGAGTAKSVIKAETALREVGLGHRLNSYPRNMSGGEQQRVAVARALAGAPHVILADEPTAALDSENGQAVMALLGQIAQDKSRAVLVVTHDPRTHPYADRIVKIEDGLIVGETRVEETQQNVARYDLTRKRKAHV